MPVVNLNNQFLLNGLICPPGKKKIEYVSSDRTGLYISVLASHPGEGTYYVRYKDANGKTCHHNLGKVGEITLEQAREQTAEFKAGLKLGQYPEKTASASKQNNDPVFIDFLLETYLPYKQNHKRSWKDDEAIINLRIKPSELAQKRLSEIKRQDIEKLMESVLASGKAAATANHVAKLVRHSLSLSVSWGYLDKNIASGIKLFPEDNEVNNILTEPQLKKLLEVLKTHENRTVSNICLWLLSTGARLNEALKAEYQHVDIEKRVWVIPAKNNKGKRLRSVPLNDTALSVFKQLTTKESDVYLFLNEKTGKPYTTIHKTWSHIREEAGVPFMRLHDLRHSYASFLVESGRTLLEVAEILGHRDIKVSRRYSHLSSSKLLEAANTASDMLNRAIREK